MPYPPRPYYANLITGDMPEIPHRLIGDDVAFQIQQCVDYLASQLEERELGVEKGKRGVIPKSDFTHVGGGVYEYEVVFESEYIGEEDYSNDNYMILLTCGDMEESVSGFFVAEYATKTASGFNIIVWDTPSAPSGDDFEVSWQTKFIGDRA